MTEVRCTCGRFVGSFVSVEGKVQCPRCRKWLTLRIPATTIAGIPVRTDAGMPPGEMRFERTS